MLLAVVAQSRNKTLPVRARKEITDIVTAIQAYDSLYGQFPQYHGKVMVWSAGPDKAIAPGLPANQRANKDNILSWAN
jgi:hypothetical protein